MPNTSLGIPTPADSVRISELASAIRAGLFKVNDLLIGDMTPELEQAIRDIVSAGIESGELKEQYMKAISSAADVELYRNLVHNGAPRAAQPTWSESYGTGGTGTKEYVEDAAAPGGGYVRMSWTASTTAVNGNLKSPPFDVIAGETYSGIAHVRSPKPNVFGATLYFYNADGVQVGSTYYNQISAVEPGEWTKLEVDGAVAPATAIAARVGFSVSPYGQQFFTGDYLDGSALLAVQGGKVPADWFDGGSDNGFWLGAFNEESLGAFTTGRTRLDNKAPIEVGVRTGSFNAEKRLYVPYGGDIEPVRRRIKDALEGVQDYRIAFIGHSMVAGQGAAPGKYELPRFFQRRAATAGKCEPGFVVAFNNTTVDTRITHGAEWYSLGNPRGDLQQHLVSKTVDAPLTFAFDHPGTDLEISTFGNSNPVAYSVDGGARVTITPSGASAIQKTVVSGLSYAPHSVTLYPTLDGTNHFVLGAELRTMQPRLAVSNFGYSGSVAEDWDADDGRFYSAFKNITVNTYNDVYFCRLGANERIHFNDPAQLAENLNALVSELKARGQQVVLIADPPMTYANWVTDFYPIYYDVADAHGVPLIDLTAHYLTRDLAGERGLFADPYHPNPLGYYEEAELLAEIML